jgi:hypothetical protein
VRWHVLHEPPLYVTEEQLREGFAMIDRALTRLASDTKEG